MWAVDADAMTCQTQQSLLLCIGKRDRLQAPEYYRVVCDDDRGLESYRFVRNSFCEVDGEEDSIRLATRRYKGRFEKQTSVIPGAICKRFWVPIRCQ